jgi:hypothetical protein
MPQASHLLSRAYGPDYGLEAIRRLEAGYAITYQNHADGILTKEYPNGRRFEMRVDPDGSIKQIRELAPASG